MKNVKHRLLFPMQAKGNVGKSLEIATRACWLSERGIEWQGFDLDADNRTLSRLFPGEVQLVPMAGRADDQDELVSVLKKVTAKPVTIVDARAHLDGVLKTALQAPHGSPPRHQNAFSPSPSKKRSRVAAPGRTVFNSPRARPLSPRAPFRIANRPALEKAAQSRHPIPLTRNLRIAQFRGGPTTAEAQTRHISTDFVMGADFGAKRSVHCTARLRLSTPHNTMSQVIHSRPEVAQKASRREAVNNLAAAVPVIPGHTAAGSRFAPASPRSAPHHPARVLSRKPTTPAARVQKSERTLPREGHRIRLTMNRVIPTNAAITQRKESQMKTWNDITHFAGFDWAKDHHDVLVLDGAGKIVAELRFDHTASGWALCQEKLAQFPQVAIAVEAGHSAAMERLVTLDYRV
jgi:hypothetical protein